MTKRDVIKAKRQLRKNKRSNVKNNNLVSASNCAYFKEKQVEKDNKALDKSNKKQAKALAKEKKLQAKLAKKKA